MATKSKSTKPNDTTTSGAAPSGVTTKPQSFWTEERIALLRELWSEKRPARDIAAAIGGGVSRNAVIGKANRLGLSESVADPAKTVALYPDNPKRGLCQWPLGDPATDDFKYCGAHVYLQQSYCLEHCGQAYRNNVEA